MIKVTIKTGRKTIEVVCHKAQQTNNRQVACYNYNLPDDEVYQVYNGHIVSVTIA